MAYANVLLTGTVGAGRVRGPGQLGGPAGQLWAAKRGVERPHLSQTLGSEVAQGTSLHLVTPHRQGIWEMTSGWAAMSPGGARAHLGENVSGPWRSEARRGDVALGAVLGWTGEAAAPGPPLSSRDRFHTHSGPRCPVAGIPWGLSLQLAYCSDHTGEEQCEPAIKKLQVGLHTVHQGSLNPAPRTGCEATPPSFLGSPQ